MTLTLMSSTFEDTSLGVSGTRTDDGQVLSLLFDHLLADSAAAEPDAAPQLRRAEGVVQCQGRGWVDAQVRGHVTAAGPHATAQLTGWVNGRRLRAAAHGADEPFSAGVSAPVGADGRLRISLLLVAQRDMHSTDSGALCAVDSIDIMVRPVRRAPARPAANRSAP